VIFVNDEIEKTRVREIRKELGELFQALVEEWIETGTQDGLAKLIGIDASMITAVKNGSRWFELDTLERVTQAMGIAKTYFDLADRKLTVKENKRMVNLLMELRDCFVTSALAKR
jgi:transcriptional regulator with XRE-family HTH domain